MHMSLKDDQGREFGSFDGAYEYVASDRDLFLTPVNPGVAQEGTVIFQVAPDAKGYVFTGDDLDFWEEKSAKFDLSAYPLRSSPPLRVAPAA